MKIQSNQKHDETALNTVEAKRNPLRLGAKVNGHRHERRRIRVQLRRLDWALAD